MPTYTGNTDPAELEETAINSGETLDLPVTGTPLYGVAVGDLLFVALARRLYRSPAQSGFAPLATPAGWTALQTVGSITGGIVETRQQATIYTRVADGTALDAPTFVWSRGFGASGTTTVAAHATLCGLRDANYQFESALLLGGGPNSTTTDAASSYAPQQRNFMVTLAANLQLATTPTFAQTQGFAKLFDVERADLVETRTMPLSVAFKQVSGPSPHPWCRWNVTQGDSITEAHAAGLMFSEYDPAPGGFRFGLGFGDGGFSLGA